MNTDQIAGRIVRQEVRVCVSLVVDLVMRQDNPYEHADDLDSLRGRYDYEQAARDEGWVTLDDWHAMGKADSHPGTDFIQVDGAEIVDCLDTDDWESLCRDRSIDPDDHLDEPLEFWAVSNWLAEELEEKGECVTHILGLNIWGRCATGQIIEQDAVIQRIAKEISEI